MGDYGDLGAAVVGGGLGILGTSMTNDANASAVAANNATQLQLQANAEAYNTQMANTVYQRGTQDLMAAGLNPILAYAHPDPAPTAPMVNTQAPQFQNVVGSGVASAMQAYQTAKQSDQADSQINLNNATAIAKTADAHASSAAALESEERTARMLRGDPTYDSENARNKAIADWQSAHNDMLQWGNFTNQASQTVLNSASALSKGTFGGGAPTINIKGDSTPVTPGGAAGRTPPTSAEQARANYWNDIRDQVGVPRVPYVPNKNSANQIMSDGGY